MAQIFKVTADISTMITLDVIKISSTLGRNIYANTNGSGFINEDSQWQLVQSTDNVSWAQIAGTVFTGENAKNVFNISDLHNGAYLGLQLQNKLTETAGILVIDICVK